MPYGLNITIPAMLFEHMVFFSFVEAIVTSLAFTYIARNSPEIIFDYETEQGKKGKADQKVAPA